MPQKWAGTRTEPPPSVAMPPAEQKAAMAAASPPLDPPGVRSRFHGIVGAAGKEIIGLEAGQHLGRIGFAQHDGSGGAQAGHHGGVRGGRGIGAQTAAGTGGQARDIETVL